MGDSSDTASQRSPAEQSSIASAAHASSPPPGPADIGAGYEHGDIRIAGVARFLVIFAVLLAGCLVVVWYVMRGAEHVVEASDPADGAPALSLPRVPPPEPRLQPSPEHPSLDAADMDALRRQQESRLAAVRGGRWWRTDPATGHLTVTADAAAAFGESLAGAGTSNSTTRPAVSGDPATQSPVNPASMPATRPTAPVGRPPSAPSTAPAGGAS